MAYLNQRADRWVPPKHGHLTFVDVVGSDFACVVDAQCAVQDCALCVCEAGRGGGECGDMGVGGVGVQGRCPGGHGADE